MSSLVYKNELLSVREFIVLAAYAGMDEIRMLSDTCQEQVRPEELNETVFRLYQRGTLRWNGDGGYELNPEIRSLLQEIKYAKREVEIRFEDGEGLLYCFINTTVTVMERSRNDVERLRLHQVSKDAFFEELSDRGIIPPRDCGSAPAEEITECESILTEFRQKNPELFREDMILKQDQREALKKVLEKETELNAYSMIYDRISGRQIMTVLLWQKDLQEYIMTMDAGHVQVMKFEWAALEKIWKQSENSLEKGR